MTVEPDILGVVEPVVGAAGMELYDVCRQGATLQILVTGPDGADLDRLAELSGQLSRALDEADPISGAYTLEVSSPGLERPLRTAAHFAGAVGEVVTVRTLPDEAGERRVTGTLASAGDTEIVVDDPDHGPRTVRIDRIERARTVFEWGPAPKPGGKNGGKKTKKKRKKVQS